MVILAISGIAGSSCSTMNDGTQFSQSTRSLAADDEAIHPHKFAPGEVFEYDYNDLDIIYCGSPQNGIPIAGEPQFLQEISIPVRIEVQGTDGHKKLTVLSNAKFRQGPSSQFNDVPFRPISELIKSFPKEFSYSYLTEHDALSHLQDIFKNIFGNTTFLADPVASFFFFKMQDIHQMQDSALSLHDGLKPGSSYLVQSHETSGLGGQFIGGPAQYIYINDIQENGNRAAFITASNLGNQFTSSVIPSQVKTTYTNFTFSMSIPLQGPISGALQSGEGQETAFPLMVRLNPDCKQTILQRQFSVRLR